MEICQSNDPAFVDLWQELISKSSLEYRPLSRLCIEFQKEYYDQYEFEDRSYIIISNTIPLIGAIISSHSIDNNKLVLSGYGYPLSYHENLCVAENELIKPRKLFMKELDNLIDQTSIARIESIDLLNNNCMSDLTNHLLLMGGNIDLSFFRMIDISQNIDRLFSQVRKSSKRNINWGRKNIKYEIYNFATITKKYF